MYSMVKEYLEKNKVIITYVRNDLGFKIGIVVAIGQDKIGWSLVNHRHDYEKRYLKPHQIPAIQKMLQRMKDYKPGVLDKDGKEIPFPKIDIFKSKAYRLYLDMLRDTNWDATSEIPVPSFDREEGLRRAIEMAVNGTFKVASWLTHPWDRPLNSYMREAITQMIDRSHRVKMFQA